MVRSFIPYEHVASPFTRRQGGPRAKMEEFETSLSAEPLRGHTSLTDLSVS